MKHIMITGAPGTGKTTLGHRLSKQLGLPLLSLDNVEPNPGNQFPGTLEARQTVKQLKTTHVIEGAQIMGFPPEELKPHRVTLLTAPETILLERLMKRGIQTTNGMELKGNASRATILKRIRAFQPIVDHYLKKRDSLCSTC